jgi:hypothetical protein
MMASALDEDWNKKTVNDVRVGDIFAVTERRIAYVVGVQKDTKNDNIDYRYQKIKDPSYALVLQIGRDDTLWREMTVLELGNGMTVTTTCYRHHRVHIV